MTLWYAAHILMYVKQKNTSAGKVPVWENIVLIKADSEEMAFAKANERGQQDAGDDDGTFRWAGHPAEWVFGGVRKLTLCEDPENCPGDGTEVSFTEMQVDSEQAISNLLAGKSMPVALTDFSQEHMEPPAGMMAAVGTPGAPAAVLAAVEISPRVPTAWVDELEQLIAEGRRPPTHSDPFQEKS